MAEKRPAIPLAVQREVLFESRERCAVCCEPLPLQRAHIRPWRRTKNHSASNLIALCANCHIRADAEKWGEAKLRRYKESPCALAKHIPEPISREQRGMIDLLLSSDPEVMSETHRKRLLSMIAAYLDVPIEFVRIVSIEKTNSTRVLLEVPQSAGEALLRAWNSRDAMLVEFLQDFASELRRPSAQELLLEHSIESTGLREWMSSHVVFPGSVLLVASLMEAVLHQLVSPSLFVVRGDVLQGGGLLFSLFILVTARERVVEARETLDAILATSRGSLEFIANLMIVCMLVVVVLHMATISVVAYLRQDHVAPSLHIEVLLISLLVPSAAAAVACAGVMRARQWLAITLRSVVIQSSKGRRSHD